MGKPIKEHLAAILEHFADLERLPVEELKNRLAYIVMALQRLDHERRPAPVTFQVVSKEGTASVGLLKFARRAAEFTEVELADVDLLPLLQSWQREFQGFAFLLGMEGEAKEEPAAAIGKGEHGKLLLLKFQKEKKIPTVTELAKLLGVHRQALYNNREFAEFKELAQRLFGILSKEDDE